MLKALLKQDALAFTPVTTGDTVTLGDRTLSFLHTPYLHWPDTQCTHVLEEKILFSGDVFGCHFAIPAYLMTKWATFAFLLNITTPTSCVRLKHR
jgi:flavorubredoxin